MSGWRLGHRPALDGFRGVAILLVLVCHSSVPGLAAAGPVGVTMFFTLSGFLISALLLEEHERAGRVDFSAFYLRRVRRLVPAMVASSLAIAAVGAGAGAVFFQWRDLAAVWLYVANWPQALGNDLGMLTGFWSLAVEEQFYLVWPIAVVMCLRRSPQAVAWVASAGIVASVATRTLLAGNSTRIYFGADTHADALLIGCLLAVLLHNGVRVRGWSWALLPAAACAFIPEAHEWTLVPLLVPALTALAIPALNSGWLAGNPMRWLGRRSYGIYLWNCPIAWLLHRTDLPWWEQAAILIPVSLTLAALSWRYVEQPFLRKGIHAHHGVPSDTTSEQTPGRGRRPSLKRPSPFVGV